MQMIVLFLLRFLSGSSTLDFFLLPIPEIYGGLNPALFVCMNDM